ncbi:winged helix-turn-helix transcriptional regulator [Nocardia goodfellowii]
MSAKGPHPGEPVRGSSTGRPIMALFDLIGRRWTLRVIWELDRAGQPLTFRELREACGDISSSVLTTRLRELVQARLVENTTGYVLTPIGRKLVGSLEPVARWAEAWEQQRH